MQWVQCKWKCGTNASKMVENLLKVIYVPEGLQQAEHLRMLNVYGLQSTKTKDPGDWVPLQPRSGTLQLLAFPKTKITFEREEISDCQWDSGKYDGAADGDWENCVRSQGAYFEGDWGVIVLCTMCLVSCIFFNKCLFFILHGWIPSGQTTHTHTHTHTHNKLGQALFLGIPDHHFTTLL